MAYGRAHPCDSGVIASVSADRTCTERAKRFVLAATILGSGMAFIDSAVVGVALPLIGSNLKAGVPVMQWVINAYVLATASLTLIGGAAGDRFGRRRVFLAGIVVFTLGSIGCGSAASSVQLIAARVVQGAGGALMIPNSLAIIGAAFDDHEKGKAIGTWAAATSIAGALGPVIGGWLADTVSWRAIFFINVPFAIVALVIASLRLPESRAENAPSRLDWPGAALAAAGLAAIAFALIQSSELGLHHPVVPAFGLAGILLLCGFAFIEARSAAPMAPLELFRRRRFSGINLLTMLLYCALSGAFFFLPFDLIRAHGYSAAAAGAAFLPFPLTMIALSRWSGGLLDRFGARLPLVAGPLITAAGFALFAVAGVGQSYWLTVFPPMLIAGFGMSVCVAPLTTAVMTAVPAERTGIASAVNNAVTDIATLLAVAVFGAAALGVFAHAMNAELGGLAPVQGLGDIVGAVEKSLAGAELPAGLTAEARASLQAAIAKSFGASLQVLMAGAAGLAGLAALCAAITLDPEK